MKTITKEQALEALDSLDDFARMAGVDAMGPRGVLEQLIAQTWGPPVLTTREAAREHVVQALAEDQVFYYFGNGVGCPELTLRFRQGFQGFDNMTDVELVQCAVTSGLDQVQSGNVLVLRSSS